MDNIILQEAKEKVREIMGNVNCPNSYQCAESGFKNICQAEDVGLTKYVACRELHEKSCPFELKITGEIYCGCPFRVFWPKNYISKPL